jgi:hypothetical protein
MGGIPVQEKSLEKEGEVPVGYKKDKNHFHFELRIFGLGLINARQPLRCH